MSPGLAADLQETYWAAAPAPAFPSGGRWQRRFLMLTLQSAAGRRGAEGRSNTESQMTLFTAWAPTSTRTGCGGGGGCRGPGGSSAADTGAHARGGSACGGRGAAAAGPQGRPPPAAGASSSSGTLIEQLLRDTTGHKRPRPARSLHVKRHEAPSVTAVPLAPGTPQRPARHPWLGGTQPGQAGLWNCARTIIGILATTGIGGCCVHMLPS